MLNRVSNSSHPISSEVGLAINEAWKTPINQKLAVVQGSFF
jgi:hypothetical protein